MLEPIVAFLDKLVTEFSWRRLGFLIGLLSLSIVVAWIYESYTGSFRLARIRKEIELLGQLADLAEKDPIKDDENLRAVYQEIRKDLDNAVRRGVVTLALTPSARKGVAAAAPWFLLSLFFVPGFLRGERDSQNALLGFVVIAVPFALVGTLLPTFGSLWINDWAYPWGSFSAVVACILVWQKKKAKQLE